LVVGAVRWEMQDARWADLLSEHLDQHLQDKLQQRGNEVELDVDDIEELADLCAWLGGRLGWPMESLPPYMSYLQCEPELKQALTPSAADEFDEMCRRYTYGLSRESLLLPEGVELVRDWVRDVLRFESAANALVSHTFKLDTPCELTVGGIAGYLDCSASTIRRACDNAEYGGVPRNGRGQNNPFSPKEVHRIARARRGLMDDAEHAKWERLLKLLNQPAVDEKPKAKHRPAKS
jgi:hypothetical protein